MKIELTNEGKLYLDALKTCLSWLAIGGEIKVESGYTLLMDEKARVGIKVWRHTPYEEQQMVMQLDGDVSWQMLVAHARSMTLEQLIILQANAALNAK